MTLAASQPFTVNTEQYYTLKVVVAGNHITGYVDGVQQVDWTNGTTELTAGKVGIRMHSTTADMDDVQVIE